MGQERIELNKGKQSVTDVLGLEKIKITRHAWKQFYSRTGYDLGGKSYNLIERLKTAKIVEIDSKEIKHPFIKDKKHLLTLCQDSLDPNLFYLIRQNKRTGILITVFMPIKSKNASINSYLQA